MHSRANMNIVIAPPGSGKSHIAGLLSNAIDADTLLPIASIYRDMTETFGEKWYFLPHATALKDSRMQAVRSKIAPLISKNQVLLTAETGLAAVGDVIHVALPSAEVLFARTKGRKPPHYDYPDMPTTERVCEYYEFWAKGSNLRVFNTLEDAILEMLG